MNKSIETAKLSRDELRYAMEEIHELNRLIHEYLRLTPQTMALVAAITGATISTPAITSDLVRHGILLAAPIVLSLVIVYHFNVASEVAARAEQRDKLNEIVNNSLNTKILLTAEISKLLRNSAGSRMAGILVATILIAIVVVGIYSSWNTVWFVYQIPVSLLSILTTYIAMSDISSIRKKAIKALDEIYDSQV